MDGDESLASQGMIQVILYEILEARGVREMAFGLRETLNHLIRIIPAEGS
jgi:hypothetical protein